ncbi:MAG: ribbon-helix-helix domain-containing protein [Cellulomonadaceae bacterium]|jgi:predicted transcriptional regulator|nr:ribbon-helix-helix domain-containing protein [Cellulomonadaceae bacterium]
MTASFGQVNGRHVTEDDVTAIVANAEAGFPGVTMRPVGRPTLGERPARTVGVRLDPDLDNALLAEIAASGHSASEVIRDALRAHLAPA